MGVRLCGPGCYLNPCQARQMLVKIIFCYFVMCMRGLLFLLRTRHNPAIHVRGFAMKPQSCISKQTAPERQRGGFFLKVLMTTGKWTSSFPSGKHGVLLLALKLEGEVKEAYLSVYLEGSPPVLRAHLVQGSNINDSDRNCPFSSPFPGSVSSLTSCSTA